MAGSILASRNLFSIITDKNLFTLDFLDSSVKHIQLYNDSECKRLQRQKNEKIASQPIGSSQINISRSKELIAVATDQKELLIWDLKDWKLLSKEKLNKRPMAIIFSNDSKNLLVADKAGDVYSFPVMQSHSPIKKVPYYDENGYTPDFEPGPEPILGHLSMLLGMTLSNDGKFLITCDRDEKIRISHFPNCYQVCNFCLGHEEFVTCIRLLSGSTNSLLSASGDGTIRLWNFLEGVCLTVLDTTNDLETFSKKHGIDYNQISTREGMKINGTRPVAITTFQITALNDHETLLVCAFNKLPLLLFYKLTSDRFDYLGGLQLSTEPIDIVILESLEIVVLQNLNEIKNENPFTVLKFDGHDVSSIESLSDHPILHLGETYKNKLREDFHPLDVDCLYKQRFDNVTDYLQRKREREQSKVASKKGKSTT